MAEHLAADGESCASNQWRDPLPAELAPLLLLAGVERVLFFDQLKGDVLI